jgi:voltage-gated potassium channel
VEWAMKLGMLAVLADATDDQTLSDAGVSRAKGLIATLQSDADNLFVILSAKAIKPALLVSARIASEQSEKKMRLAGADYVFAPYDMTGNRMAQVMLKPHVSQFIDFTTKGIGLDVGIEQVRVPATGGQISKTLQQMQIRRELGVIILAIRKSDGRMLFNPPAEAEIEAGDFLIAMGETANLQKLEQMLTEVQA